MAPDLLLLSLIGLMVSLYAYAVRLRIRRDRTYKPLCDISEKVSCSKAFSSGFATTAGIPNPLFGILFYCGCALISLTEPGLMIWLAVPGFIAVLYLAVISYIIQRNFCVVCSTVYLINTLLFLLAVVQKG